MTLNAYFWDCSSLAEAGHVATPQACGTGQPPHTFTRRELDSWSNDGLMTATTAVIFASSAEPECDPLHTCL